MNFKFMAAASLMCIAAVTAVGLAPTEKELTGSALVSGQAQALVGTADGFAPKGPYTLEFKLRSGTDARRSSIRLFGQTGPRRGFTFTVGDSAVNFLDPSSIPYPDVVTERSNTKKDVTLRLAVTDDSVHIYRNGIFVGARSLRYAPLPQETATGQADSENLIVNGDFESTDDITYNTIVEEQGTTCLRTMDGWFIYPNFDVWNSRAFLATGTTGNGLRIQRYSWSAGSQWTDGLAQQTVNVVPGQTYTFSFNGYGGEYDGKYYGYAKLEEVGTNKSKTIDIKNPDAYEQYSMDYTPSANCSQLRVVFGVKFPGGIMDWGEVPTVPVFVDDVVLKGKTLTFPEASFGYTTEGGSEVKEVRYDGTGAYAPVIASITTDTDYLELDAANGKSEAKLAVTGKGLTPGTMITFEPSPYVKVTPPKLPSTANGQKVRVSYNGTREHVIDTLVIKNGTTMHKVVLDLRGKPLPTGTPANRETTTAKTFSVPFAGASEYSLEVRAKVKAGSKKGLRLYAAGADGHGFAINVADSALTADNPKSTQENPMTVSSRKNSDMAHTYRVAASADNLLYIYRDGNLAGTVDAADVIIPSDLVAGGVPFTGNLLQNPDFNGPYEVSYVEDGGLQPYVSKIQGWDIYPVEPWNTRQYIAQWEINEDEGYDMANKGLKLQRYGWNAGFSDGLIGQAVNVASGTEYTLSYLAKGGRHEGKNYGYVRMEEVNNPTKGVTLPITSDEAKAYTMKYTPSANCSQMRVVVGLKSPGAIGSWGSVPEVPIMVDKFVLTGQKAIGNGTAGFTAEDGTEVEYFAYDLNKAVAPAKPSITVSEEKVRIDGTDKGVNLKVTAKDLNTDEDIMVICPEGIKAIPEKLKYNSNGSTLRLVLTSQANRLLGNVILRSGTTKAKIAVDGRGTPIPEKLLNSNPVYIGSDKSWSAGEANGFNPGEDGYTVEFRAKTTGSQEFAVTATDAEGTVHPFAQGAKMGVYNGSEAETRKALEDDKAFHTYRYAVTKDRHVFVYRDGVPVDTMFVDDFANPAGLTTHDAGKSANLLSNPGFEGASKLYSMSDDTEGDVFTNYVQGWTILDGSNGWNARTYISEAVVSDRMGDDNHVLELERYRWEDGWTDAKVSQVIDVVPGTPYTLSAMVMGGFRKDNDASLGFIRIEDTKNPTRYKEVSIAEKNRYEFGRQSVTFTPSASCSQVRVILGLKKAGKNNECERARFDDVVLSGNAVTFDKKLSFSHNGELEYFTYDATGAYAPNLPHIYATPDELTFSRTLEEQTITVSSSDVKDADKIRLVTTGNFLVEPEEVEANAPAQQVTVTFLGTQDGNGELRLIAGGFIQTVALTGEASPLESKDISPNPVYTGAEGKYLADATVFNPGKQGYTIELAGELEQYSGGAFELSALNNRDYGVNLVVCDEFSGVSFEKGNITFLGDGVTMIPNAGKFVYRVTVTPDNQAIIFKDKAPVDTIDISGLPADISFLREGESTPSDNLVRNGNFAGRYEYTQYEEAYMLSSLAGWHTSGLSEWNARAYISADGDNPGSNVLNIQRYDWNPGWADGLISQVIDVCPNSTYTFSAECRGGSQDGYNLAYMDISEVGYTNTKSINISSSSNDFLVRKIKYTTGPDCHQVKIAFRLESSGKEGNGPKCSFYVRNVKLEGDKPLFNPGIYLNSDAPFKLNYFTYDLTGAYLPEGMVDIADTDLDDMAIGCTTAPGTATLTNLPEGSTVTVFNVSGMEVRRIEAAYATESIPLDPGCYIVRVDTGAAPATFKIFIK